MVSSNKRLEKNQLTFPVNAVDLLLSSIGIKHNVLLSAASLFCIKIEFQNAEVLWGVYSRTQGSHSCCSSKKIGF